MHLTPDELTRLEQMFAKGQVRSDPPELSPTDRLLDAMKSMPRPLDQVPVNVASQTTRPAPAADPTIERPRQHHWHALEHLIEMRRALLSGEKFKLP